MSRRRERRERTINRLDPWPHKERGAFVSRFGLSALTDDACDALARSLIADVLHRRRVDRQNRLLRH